MKLDPKVPTHARKRCPKDLFKETYDIGRSGDPKFKSTFETVESAGTSNPRPPRSFRRGEESSFKDSRVFDGRKVGIAPRA